MLKILQKAVVTLSLVLTLVGTLTFIMTYANIGFSDIFIAQWLSSLLLAVTIMAPVGYVLITLLEKLIDRLLPNLSKNIRNLSTGIIMSLTMGSVMAVVATLNNIGYTNLNLFIGDWANAFLSAIPVGLTFSIVMTLFIKPKFDQYISS